MAKRDSQRSAVYAWEAYLEKRYPHLMEPMKPAAIRALVERVWVDYRGGREPPEVYFSRGNGYAQGSRWRVKIPKWARHLSIVLHETAHALVDPCGAPHGPVFARTYLDLLHRYADLPLGAAKTAGVNLIRLTDSTRRVHFARPAACPRPQSRAMKAWEKEYDRLAALEREAKAALNRHRQRRPDA